MPGLTGGVYGSLESGSSFDGIANTSSSPYSAGAFLGVDIAPGTEAQLRIPLLRSQDTPGVVLLELRRDL